MSRLQQGGQGLSSAAPPPPPIALAPTASTSTTNFPPAFTATGAPQATYDLLESISRTKLFPESGALPRPDTSDEDSDRGKLVLDQRATFVRLVLGGWLAQLASEEGKNGCNASTRTTETVDILSTSIASPLNYIKIKPTVLLFIPSGKPDNPALGALTADSNPDGVALGDGDLATFLLPRILRASASLEGALLSTPAPLPDADDDAAQHWRKCSELKVKLEQLLYEVVRVLAVSGVRLDWRSKDPSAVQGGVGKAREMVREMVRLLRSLLPSEHNSASLIFPRILQVSDSTAFRKLPGAPDTSDASSIPLRSALHTRAFFLTTLRTLHRLTQASPFLADFFPQIVDLLVESWPIAVAGHDDKGKQPLSPHHDRILEATLLLAEQFLHPDSTNSTHAAALIAERAVEELQARIMSAPGDAMDVDGQNVCEKIETSLARIFSGVWGALKQGKEMEGGLERMAHVVTMAVMESGEQMVDCIAGEDSSPALQLCCIFALAAPLMARPAPSGATPHLSLITNTGLELLPSELQHQLEAFASLRTRLPCDLSPLLSSVSLSAKAAWKDISADLREKLGSTNQATQPSTRKRRRGEDSQHPTSDAYEYGEGMTAPSTAAAGKRKKVAWMETVGTVLQQMNGGAALNLETEGVENMVLRMCKSLPTTSIAEASGTLRAVGLMGCARDGCLTFTPIPDDPALPDEPHCTYCDAWIPNADLPSILIPTPARVFTETPVNAMREVVRSMLGATKDEKIRLAFLKALARLVGHSKCPSLSLSADKVDPLLSCVWQEMESSVRAIRMAAGNVIAAIVQARQEHDESHAFVDKLFKRFDVCLSHKQPAVIESALITVGRVARLATPQSLLECRCLESFVTRLGHGNTLVKSLARIELEQVAKYRGIKPYALINPHYQTIAPLFIQSRSSYPILSVILEIFQQSRGSLLVATREYTLPFVILSGDREMLEQIAEASNLSICKMLVEPTPASAILTHLFVVANETERHRGLATLLKEINSGGNSLRINDILQSVKMPLVYGMALKLGDEDQKVQEKAERGLQEFWRKCSGIASNTTTNVGVILKDCIVAILLHMNKGLTESTGHRPLREKQKILRSLEAITKRVGAGMAGFSPQIFATLQGALDVAGLRSVSLHAIKVVIETLKFNEIGPFLGTTSATFVRLWPSFSPTERIMATQTLEYVVVKHGDDLTKFGKDIADLGGIPELAAANHRLRESRKTWSFTERCNTLLQRVGGESEVVGLQALKELKELFSGRRNELQQLAAGDSFDPLIGRIVVTLFTVAAKDGNENEQLRNVALECIGMLGALDPDRFEVPPGPPPMIVKENFEDHEESIDFALHLIEDLLIGAYRATNDTKHQESLAYAIQELLSFCGFTSELVNPTNLGRPVDASTKERWFSLPPSVLETCGPLLGSLFSFNHRALAATSHPIYASTTMYRDWIRTWASDLISKVSDGPVKRIFGAFPPILHLEDISVAQHLLPHLVLHTLIAGDQSDRHLVRKEIETVLTDQVSPSHQLAENSRLLSAQTVFGLLDHLSRWITHARKRQSEIADRQKRTKVKGVPSLNSPPSSFWDLALINVELALSDIPHILVGEAALTCKAYARSLLNFETHIVAHRERSDDDAKLQHYYENLHECYAELDEPDGMEGISTKIISPSIQHQIREHESTGRWTSAQSCWEVKLQQHPEEPKNHVGLLRCLQNLGHYDSMRTHIVGVLHNRNEAGGVWERTLAPFNIEASLIVGDLDAVEHTLCIPDIEGPEVAFGKVISAMRQGDLESLSRAFFDGREQLGGTIIAAGKESYRRVYNSVVHLHILHELEQIHRARLTHPDQVSADLLRSLRTRLDATSPSFRAREPILNMRRTALHLASSSEARREVAELWLVTSKIARKAGHSQTAYSAILQARDLSDPKDKDAPFVFLQEAKLLKAGDEPYKAIQTIDNALRARIPPEFNSKDNIVNLHYDSPLIVRGAPTVLAKASLRRARWMHEAGRLEPTDIVIKYKEASRLAPDWETPHYYLGHYHDSIEDASDANGTARMQRRKSQRDTMADDLKKKAELRAKIETCQQFSTALRMGTKFIYQAMPRMLTIWLKCGEDSDVLEVAKRQKKDKTDTSMTEMEAEAVHAFNQINFLMEKNAKKLVVYQWLTVLPQLVSRVLHPNEAIIINLEAILIRVLHAFPHQGFWAMASGVKSQQSKRARRCTKIIGKADALLPAGKNSKSPSATGIALVDQLLILCNHPVSKTEPLKMKTVFPNLYRMSPLSLIIPLQSSLNVSLPSDASQMQTHKAFPDRLPTFLKFEDTIVIMSSLQRPRKISVRGDNGVTYSFLCKPKDDLRKDARLMEFNSMIIKLLRKDSDARNRRLDIRTYAVVPLNEECGLIEWVPNVVVLRSILNKLYARHNIAPWSPELKKIFDTIRDVPEKTAERFDNEVLTKFKPVFHEWFLEAFPEPSAWLRARLAYSRTAAVISMVGFVLGLGDRHCENILLDGTTGDTVHVDFNCLFDRGRTFDVAEQVPFRLTTNIIAGMGVTGVEGVYRRSAEITLRILRNNKDSLMSVLETFLHDPLVEWIGPGSHKKTKDLSAAEQAQMVSNKAKASLEPISNKLRGLQVTSDPETKGDNEVDVAEQVERLIREARNSKYLGSIDHAIPCSACVKRGQASACSAPAKRKRGVDPAQELDERRTAALSEIALMRNTLDILRARLPNLEHFIAHSGAPEDDSAALEDAMKFFGKNEGPGSGAISSSVPPPSHQLPPPPPRLKRDAGGSDGEESIEGDPARKRARNARNEPIEREGTNGTDGGDDSAAVDAAVDLEYATLGRSRAFPVSNDRAIDSPMLEESLLDDARHSIARRPPLPASPVLKFPDGASLAAVAPTRHQEEVIFRHGIELLGWHHRVFHGPTFYRQVTAFWDLGPAQFETCSPAFLSLYFALLSVGTKLLGPGEQAILGWSEAETAMHASEWFDCCVSNLYRHNFLEHHDLHSLQAIAVLALSGRDAGSPTLIANLLSAGLSIAQDLGLHRMVTDERFYESEMAGKSTPMRAKLLIDREMKKRAFWALVHTDWFSIPFRSSWILGKVQISTPLPLNATDDDLLLGENINRHPNEFTPASWLLQYIDVGHACCESYEKAQHYRSDAAYQEFLKIDSHLRSIVDNPPLWLSTNNIEAPQALQFMHSTFIISVHHKILCIHRPYLYKPYKGPIVEYARQRVISSARSILREAPLVVGNRIWTALYHIASAQFILMLELFDRSKKASPSDLEAIRNEVRGTMPTMENLSGISSIADRGLALIGPLLAEEQRLRREAAIREDARAVNSSLYASTSAVEGEAASFPVDLATQASSSLPEPFSSHDVPVPAHDDAFSAWFYDLGIENSEHWLHSQLSNTPDFVLDQWNPAFGAGL